MTAATLEHVNLTVKDAEKTATLLCTLFDWTIRWHGPSQLGGYTYHVGNDEAYLAIYMAARPQDYPGKANKMTDTLNHVGVVVDDLEQTERKILDAGFKSFSHGDYEPGRRFYFLDNDNIEYEVVSYKDHKI